MSGREYVISGDPVALARPRMYHNKMWDSQKEVKLVTGLQLANQHNGAPLFEGPLAIDITFLIQPAISRKKKTKLGTPHIFKPDLDNMIKFILDVCNGILYKDDCSVASITASKKWAETGCTIFTISHLE